MIEFIFLFLLTSFLTIIICLFLIKKYLKYKNIKQYFKVEIESLKLNSKYFITSVIFVVFILSISLLFPLALIFNQLGFEYLFCIIFFVFVIFYILIYTFLKRIIT